jgi:hypothetical protein
MRINWKQEDGCLESLYYAILESCHISFPSGDCYYYLKFYHDYPQSIPIKIYPINVTEAKVSLQKEI